MNRVLGWSLIASSLAACAVDVGESSVQQAELGKEETPLQQASDWVGAFSSWVELGVKVYEFADTYGEEPPEQRIQRLLYALYEQSKRIEDMLAGISIELPRITIENDVANTAFASMRARSDLKTYGKLSPLSPPGSGYLLESGEGTWNIATSPALWEHLFTEEMTNGEWTLITPFRPPVNADTGTAWDYRWALPGLMAAVAMRVNVIAAVDPDGLGGDKYDEELAVYRAKIKDTKDKIEAQMGCAFRVAGDVTYLGFGRLGFVYHVHAICGEPYTGIEEVTVLDIADDYPWELPIRDWYSQGFDVWAYNDSFLWWWKTPILVRELRERFWTQLGEHLEFRQQMDAALNANFAKLRTRVGLFEMRRMIDALDGVIMHDPGLTSYDRVRSAFTNMCLSYESVEDIRGWIDAVRTATCDTPFMSTPGQRWVSLPEIARLQEHDSGKCLSTMDSPYFTSWAILDDCNDADERQRWSYSPADHRLRNPGGLALDIYNGNTEPGTSVWTYYDTGSAAQLWGFRSSWVTSGLGGPHL